MREEFIERMEKIQKEPTIKVENIWKFLWVKTSELPPIEIGDFSPRTLHR